MQIQLARACYILAVLALCSTGTAQRGFFVADGLEVSFRPPPKWTHLGSKGDLGSLRALFCAPRSYAPTDGRGTDHTPTLRLLWFPTSDAKKADDKKSDYPMATPYTDIKDYLGRVNGPGGKTVAVEAGTFGKFQGRRYVVEFERAVGGITLHTCSIKMDNGELAVEFEVLTEQYKRLKGQFKKCFSTLAATPPEKIKQRMTVETPKWISDYDGWKKMSTTDRAKYRRDWGKRWLTARKQSYEPGWKVVKSKHWLVLSRTDSKFTKRIVQAADNARKWVDKRFDKISDEIMMPAVMRIFHSQRQENAFRLRENNPLAPRIEYSHAHREIYAFKDASMGNLGDGYGKVLRGVFQQFIHDKHHRILGNIPRWLDNGLWLYMEGSRTKGKKLIFFPHDVEMGRFKILAERKQPQNTWWFIQEKMVETPKDGAIEPVWGYRMECCRLLRWFDEGGSKIFQQEDLLVSYLGQIGETAMKFRAKPDDGVDWIPVADGEATKLRKACYARRDDFLVKVNYSVIPIPVADWSKADKLWQAYNAEFAKRKFKKK
jgi:hypothetical protein